MKTPNDIMGSMEKSIKISYIWRNESGKIPLNHMEELSNHAEEKALEYMQEGYVSGQLLHEIDGIDYQGWCDIIRTTNEA